MKWILALALQVALVFALATSCSVTHRSGDYACTKSSDCNGDRVCSEGFCVVRGTDVVDAPVTPPGDGHAGDASSNGCPTQCTSCTASTHTCVIDCNNGANCTNQVACPAGWACDVKCDADNSCRNGVECAGTTSCTVECSGKNACEEVACGTSKCEVDCTGQGSCKSVACGSSCACDVKCPGVGSCTGSDPAVTCTAPACRIGLGCSSFATACHSCM